MDIEKLKKIQPDFDTKESYQHGFYDALQVVIDMEEKNQLSEHGNGRVELPVIWRQFPSEDLPDEDTFILVWRAGYDSPQVMYFSWVKGDVEDGGGWYLSELDGDNVKDMPLIKDEDAFPTHWMPLPELPTI